MAALPHTSAQQFTAWNGNKPPVRLPAPIDFPAPVAAADGALPAEFVTVAPGDTAYSLAKRHGLTVPELLALNHLSSHDLQAGQVLRVLASPPYQVAKGDTAYGIAQAHGVSVAHLMAVNNLAPDAHIEIGQWLTIPGPEWNGEAPKPDVYAARPGQSRPDRGSVYSAGQAATVLRQAGLAQVPAEPDVPTPLRSTLPQSRDWRANALALLGTPYVYGGNSERGIDCSAFVLRVFQPLGVNLPRTSAAQARIGFEVSREELSAGDLVFFDTVDSGKVTHVGIYLGDQEFVNANSYLGKVAIDSLESKYWAPRFLGARRILSAGVQAQGGANYD